jgi:hypothetical protein
LGAERVFICSFVSMRVFDVLAIHGASSFFELKNQCQLSAACKFCRALYYPLLLNIQRINYFIDSDGTDWLSDRSLVALTQTCITINDILHIILRYRRTVFLANLLVERLQDDAGSDDSEDEW